MPWEAMEAWVSLGSRRASSLEQKRVPLTPGVRSLVTREVTQVHQRRRNWRREEASPAGDLEAGERLGVARGGREEVLGARARGPRISWTTLFWRGS